MTKILEFRDYSFKYAGANSPTLNDISFSVEEGEIVVIAGASGSGKSTLLRSINGLIPHIYPGEYSGEVIVDGLLVKDTPTFELAKRVGFLFQNPENQIFMFTVERDVAFGLENLGYPPEIIRKKTDWAMQLLGISHLAKRSPSELSDGQKQRVAIAGSLVMDPKILVLDEPTSLLDPRAASDVIELVKKLNRELGLTVILVEHRFELVAAVASRFIVISKGRIWGEGPPEEILFSEGLDQIGLAAPPIVQVEKNLLKKGIEIEKTLDVNHFARRATAAWQR
ncbi:MAG: ABC transporter ATP-binding protein [Conexivisphaerales archaeon]